MTPVHIWSREDDSNSLCREGERNKTWKKNKTKPKKPQRQQILPKTIVKPNAFPWTHLDPKCDEITRLPHWPLLCSLRMRECLMSSGSVFTSCVVIVVAVLVWIFYQKTKAAHRTKAALLSPRSHGIMWLSSSSEGLAECIPNTWSNLLAWLETSSAMCCWQKSIRPISQESDIQTSWGTVLLKQFQSP